MFNKICQNDITTDYCGFNITKMLVIIIIFLVPIHYYICELFLDNSKFDNLLRDIIIFMLIFILYNNLKLKMDVIGKWIIISDIVLFIFCILSIFIDGQASGKLNVLRTYCVPTLAYFIFRKINFSSRELKKILSTYIYLMSIVSIYGIIASFILGEEYLISLGYPSQEGHLAGSSYYINYFFGQPRNTGIFVGPNTAGVLFSFAICILLFTGDLIRRKHKRTLFIILTLGLLSTFSRSAIFGLVAAILFVRIMLITKRVKKTRNEVLVTLPMIISLIVGTIVIDNFVLDGLFSRMLISTFTRMLNGTDLSTQQHIKDLYEPLLVVMSNPFGRGFGNNGPMAAEFSIRSQNVESSLYLMMYETGPLLGIFPFIPYFIIIYKTYKKKRNNDFYAAAAISITSLFTYLLLPNIQTYEILFFCYMIFGLYMNQHVISLFESEIIKNA